MLLRAVCPEDIAIFCDQQNDPEACALAAFPLRVPTNITRTIVVDGRVVGNLGSYLAEGHREVGYWLGREYWGRGYGSAALAAFVAEINERPLFAHVIAHNCGSLRVLEKCGFVLIDEPCGSADELFLTLAAE